MATSIRRAIQTEATREQLSFEVQGSAIYVPMMYEDSPEEYTKMAKTPLAAHLTNTAPKGRLLSHEQN